MGKQNIGKPQKSRKHKKLKSVDPFSGESRKHNADRAHKNRFKRRQLNEKPENIDDQEIPYSAKELIKLRSNLTNKSKKKKRNAQEKYEPATEKGMTRPLITAPVFKRGRYESMYAFKNRMHMAVEQAIFESKTQEDYEVVDESDKHEGKKEVPKTLKTTKKKEKRGKGKKERLEKFKERKVNKQLSKLEKHFTGFEHLEDQVAFDEVAMEPPNLIKPKSTSGTSRKEWKGLILNDILKEGEKKKVLKAREVGKSLKRKHMAPVQQVKMDAERNRAIQMYRDIKNSKSKYNMKIDFG